MENLEKEITKAALYTKNLEIKCKQTLFFFLGEYFKTHRGESEWKEQEDVAERRENADTKGALETKSCSSGWRGYVRAFLATH